MMADVVFRSVSLPEQRLLAGPSSHQSPSSGGRGRALKVDQSARASFKPLSGAELALYRRRRQSFQNQAAEQEGAGSAAQIAAIKKLSWWCWQYDNLIWRGAFWFFVGSIFFMTGSFSGLFVSIERHMWANRLLVLWPYALGSPLYTFGEWCFVLQAWRNLQAILAPLKDSSQLPDKPLDHQISINSLQTGTPVDVPLFSPLSDASGILDSDGSLESDLRLSMQPLNVQAGTNGCRPSAEEGVLHHLLSASPAAASPASADGEGADSSKTSAKEPSEAAGVTDDASLFLLGKASPAGESPVAGLRWVAKAAAVNEEIFWAVVDLVGAVGVWIGTLLYNTSCITPALLDLAWMTVTTIDPYKWLVLVPNVIAGTLFVLGSYASWAVYYRTFSLLIFELDSVTWWALVFFLLGSLGFFSGCTLMTQPIWHNVSANLVSSWFGLFFGYALGSCCFFLGSWAMIADMARSTVSAD